MYFLETLNSFSKKYNLLRRRYCVVLELTPVEYLQLEQALLKFMNSKVLMSCFLCSPPLTTVSICVNHLQNVTPRKVVRTRQRKFWLTVNEFMLVMMLSNVREWQRTPHYPRASVYLCICLARHATLGNPHNERSLCDVFTCVIRRVQSISSSSTLTYGTVVGAKVLVAYNILKLA